MIGSAACKQRRTVASWIAPDAAIETMWPGSIVPGVGVPLSSGTPGPTPVE
jgi:hypothetical protein